MKKIPRIGRIQIIIQTIFSGIGLLLAAGLLFVAINLKSPYLLPLRAYEVPFLLIVSTILIVIYFLKTSGIQRALILTILLATLTFALCGEGMYRYRKDAILNGTGQHTPQSHLLGEHFIVGYEQLETLKPLVSQGLIGGIFITRRNVAGKSMDTLRAEIAELQQLRVNAGLPLLIVTTDQEGGIVSHVSPPLEKLPSLSSLLSVEGQTKEALLNNVNTYGQRQGQSLANLGITVNFSPVVDLKSNRVQSKLDFHSKINQRAISANPALTAEVAAAYVQGLQSQGVQATLKHFPGLGSVPGDTHHFSATLNIPTRELQAHDWIPFKQLATQNNALIMLGHVILPQIDANNPSSFSKDVVQTIIRKGWEHEGILITDDMTMRAAYSHGICQATVKALNAGVDLLLISYDYDKFIDAMYCANQAYESGGLDKDMLQLSHERLLRFSQ